MLCACTSPYLNGGLGMLTFTGAGSWGEPNDSCGPANSYLYTNGGELSIHLLHVGYCSSAPSHIVAYGTNHLPILHLPVWVAIYTII